MTVDRWDVHEVAAFAGGASFGAHGPQVIERGVMRCVVDATAAANAHVTDLGHAADGAGRVGFEADYRWVRPVEDDGRTKVLLVIPNRGMVGALPFSRDAVAAFDAHDPGIGAGDGFVLGRGWSVLWIGWQWDVVRSAGRLGVEAPLARIDGRPITGLTRVEFMPQTWQADHVLADSVPPIFTFAPLPTVEIDDPDAVLTVRTSLFGPREVIPRDRWRFARVVDGAVAPSATHVWLDGGFAPFHTYDLVYRTDHSVVTGVGQLAVRDAAAFLRDHHGTRHVVAFGASQSGRFLRQMLRDGAHADERGRRVIDGMYISIAGARMGEFTQRFAQPALAYAPGFAHRPPRSMADLVAGSAAGVEPPRTISVNSSFEYWRGDAAYVHTSDAGADLADPEWSRAYLLTGADHMGPVPYKELHPTANPVNRLATDSLARALFVALDEWVCDDVAPPASAVPTIGSGTLVAPAAVLATTRRIPGFATPDDAHVPFVPVLDLGPDADRGIARWPARVVDALPSFVPAVDDDANETAGIRTPAHAVPLATYAGWNPRRVVDGLPNVLLEFLGSAVSFPVDEPAARAAGDPRVPISARHADRAVYATALRQAADALVDARHLLADDVERVVAEALVAYDAVV